MHNVLESSHKPRGQEWGFQKFHKGEGVLMASQGGSKSGALKHPFTYCFKFPE